MLQTVSRLLPELPLFLMTAHYLFGHVICANADALQAFHQDKRNETSEPSAPLRRT